MSSSRGKVARAEDVVPAAFAEETVEDANETLELDVGHLLVADAATVTRKELGPHGPRRNEALRQMAQKHAQALVQQLWDLPVRKTNMGPMVTLPKPLARLPRARPLPEPKKLTRWEEYALQKGIKKRKRERMLWDEEMKEWRPRYGYKRANDEMRDWVIDVKPGDDPYDDPFEARAQAKKERIIKNKLSHIRNLERAAGAGAAAGIPAPLAMEVPQMALDVKKTKARGARGVSLRSERKQSGNIKTAKLAVAQLSTASIGKFDKVLDGEPARPVDSRKRRRTAVERTEGERSRDMDVLRKVLGGSAYGIATPREGQEPAPSGAGAGGGKSGSGSKKGKGGGKKGKQQQQQRQQQKPSKTPQRKGNSGGVRGRKAK